MVYNTLYIIHFLSQEFGYFCIEYVQGQNDLVNDVLCDYEIDDMFVFPR